MNAEPVDGGGAGEEAEESWPPNTMLLVLGRDGWVGGREFDGRVECDEVADWGVCCSAEGTKAGGSSVLI